MFLLVATVPVRLKRETSVLLVEVARRRKLVSSLSGRFSQLNLPPTGSDAAADLEALAVTQERVSISVMFVFQIQSLREEPDRPFHSHALGFGMNGSERPATKHATTLATTDPIANPCSTLACSCLCSIYHPATNQQQTCCTTIAPFTLSAKSTEC